MIQDFGNRIDDFEEFFTKALVSGREKINSVGLPVKDGLFNLLDYLKTTNLKLAVASSSATSLVVTNCERVGIDAKIFTSIIGGEKVTHSKPHPQTYLNACEVLKISPEDAIAIEDSDHGITSAFNAGLKPILIPDIKKPTDDALQMAYKTCSSLNDVINIISSELRISQ